MPIISRHRELAPDPASCWLQERASAVTSQNGEDGIIAAIFEKIGTTNRWCIEFGAWDGQHLSNTWALLNQQGWSGVQIEGNPQKAAVLAERYQNRDDVITMNRLLSLEGEDRLDQVLAGTPMPAEPDLMVIDVDGLDWHIWQSLVDYRPRVLVVEFNPSMPNEFVYVQDATPGLREGASVAALVELGRRKGYELACVRDPNAFFVRSEDFAALEIPNNDLDNLRRQSPFLSQIIQFYDGRVGVLGATRQIWTALPLQVGVAPAAESAAQ